MQRVESAVLAHVVPLVVLLRARSRAAMREWLVALEGSRGACVCLARPDLHRGYSCAAGDLGKHTIG